MSSGQPPVLQALAEQLGGKIEWAAELPDGSGAAIMSMPLPKDHWIYAEGDNEPPAPWRIGCGVERKKMADEIRAAAKFAIRACTMHGKEMDFDPDAMVQTLIVGLLGYWTEDGFSHVMP